MKVEGLKKMMKKVPKDNYDERTKGEKDEPKLIKHEKRGRTEEQMGINAQRKKKKFAIREETVSPKKDGSLELELSAVKTSGRPKQIKDTSSVSCDAPAVKTSGKPKQEPEMVLETDSHTAKSSGKPKQEPVMVPEIKINKVCPARKTSEKPRKVVEVAPVFNMPQSKSVESDQQEVEEVATLAPSEVFTMMKNLDVLTEATQSQHREKKIDEDKEH